MPAGAFHMTATQGELRSDTDVELQDTFGPGIQRVHVQGASGRFHVHGYESGGSTGGAVPPTERERRNFSLERQVGVVDTDEYGAGLFDFDDAGALDEGVDYCLATPDDDFPCTFETTFDSSGARISFGECSIPGPVRVRGALRRSHARQDIACHATLTMATGVGRHTFGARASCVVDVVLCSLASSWTPSPASSPAPEVD